MSRKYLINETAPSSFVFAAAPATGQEHFVTGMDVTLDAPGKLDVGPIVLHLGQGIASPRFGKGIGVGVDTAILVTCGSAVGGMIYYETR